MTISALSLSLPTSLNKSIPDTYAHLRSGLLSISRSNGMSQRVTEQAGPGDRRYWLLTVADANVQSESK